MMSLAWEIDFVPVERAGQGDVGRVTAHGRYCAVKSHWSVQDEPFLYFFAEIRLESTIIAL